MHVRVLGLKPVFVLAPANLPHQINQHTYDQKTDNIIAALF